jgi:signal transduction histidine kinase
VEATMTHKEPLNYRHHWEEIGNQRLYTLARWLMLIPLVALINQTYPVWPIRGDSEALVFVLWLYLGFSLLMSIALLIPAAAVVLHYTFIADLLLLLLMTFLNQDQPTLFYPFLIIPLVSLSVNQKPLISMGAGLVTALLYMFIVKTGAQGATISYITLGAYTLMLIFIPWFASSLMRQWSTTTRRHISEAEQKKETALNEVQIYRERLRSFSNVTETLANSMDYKQVLKTALREVQKIAPYTVGMVVLSSGQAKELFVAAIEPANPTDQEKKFSINEGAITNIMRPRSSPVLINNISQDPELEPLTTLRSCKAACLIPLRIKMVTYGALLVASNEEDAFTHEHLDLLSGMANYIIVALHTTQLQFDVKQSKTRLIAKEKEVRDRIASRIHDGPTQKVAQIAMNTEFIKQVAKKDPSMLPAELDKFGELAKAANSEMRMTLFELRPLTLETEGMRAALKEYTEKMKLRCGDTRLKIETKGGVDNALDTEAAGVLFDIIQESVNNALKHAEAQTITIRVEQSEGIVTTTIKDDGKGFDLESARQAAAKRASFGLQNFGERAQLIDGTVDIDSAPGQGTSIIITLPARDA